MPFRETWGRRLHIELTLLGWGSRVSKRQGARVFRPRMKALIPHQLHHCGATETHYKPVLYVWFTIFETFVRGTVLQAQESRGADLII